MNPVIQITAAFMGSIGFARLFNLHGKWIYTTALGGGLSWIVYLLTGLLINSYSVQYLMAGFTLEIYSEIMAIRSRAPSTVYLAVGMIPLIPGAALYRTMQYTVMKEFTVAASYQREALVTGVSIASGIIIGAVCWNFKKNKNNKKNKTI